MFDSLLHKNTKLEYGPSLATSWKALNDTTWEFKLRRGVKRDDRPWGFATCLDCLPIITKQLERCPIERMRVPLSKCHLCCL